MCKRALRPPPAPDRATCLREIHVYEQLIEAHAVDGPGRPDVARGYYAEFIHRRRQQIPFRTVRREHLEARQLLVATRDADVDHPLRARATQLDDDVAVAQ